MSGLNLNPNEMSKIAENYENKHNMDDGNIS